MKRVKEGGEIKNSNQIETILPILLSSQNENRAIPWCFKSLLPKLLDFKQTANKAFIPNFLKFLNTNK